MLPAFAGVTRYKNTLLNLIHNLKKMKENALYLSPNPFIPEEVVQEKGL